MIFLIFTPFTHSNWSTSWTVKFTLRRSQAKILAPRESLFHFNKFHRKFHFSLFSLLPLCPFLSPLLLLKKCSPKNRYILRCNTNSNTSHVPSLPVSHNAGERDVFDKLFEQAPDKLETVKKVKFFRRVLNFQTITKIFQTLCQFCTRVLQDMDIVISDIDTQVTRKYLLS